MSKIPDLTPELEERIRNNTEALIALGVKDWMRGRRKKASMTEDERKEVLRKIQHKIEEGE
jgi:hypothetical protein